MTEVDPKAILGALDFNRLKALRDEASRMIEAERSKKAKRVNTYIPAEVRDDFDAAVKWAYERGLIKRPSEWLFCQMAARNAILYIIEQKRAEDLEKARTAAAMSSQMTPSVQSQSQHTTEPSKTA